MGKPLESPPSGQPQHIGWWMGPPAHPQPQSARNGSPEVIWWLAYDVGGGRMERGGGTPGDTHVGNTTAEGVRLTPPEFLGRKGIIYK